MVAGISHWREPGRPFRQLVFDFARDAERQRRRSSLGRVTEGWSAALGRDALAA